MTALYYLAAYLTAAKLTNLGAWTDDSPRATDLGAFGILGAVMVVLAMVMT